MKITVLAGGVGGAKFLRGLRHAVAQPGPLFGSSITAIINTGDDAWIAGLKVCPDLDSVMYTLSGESDDERGWGRTNESERVSAELTAYGVGWPWFTLGDLDLGTHIARSSLLRDGLTLSEATARLCSRWDLGVTLVPASDHDIPTIVETVDGQRMHFEQWWVKHRAGIAANAFVQQDIEHASAAPGVLEAIRDADLVMLAPSNPVVSIGTVLGVPGVREAVRTTAAPVVGISPIIDGAAVRGMAAACLSAIGVSATAEAVGAHYGSRTHGGVLDAWLVDPLDSAAVSPLASAGIATHAVPLWMTTVASSAQLALDAATFATALPR